MVQLAALSSCSSSSVSTPGVCDNDANLLDLTQSNHFSNNLCNLPYLRLDSYGLEMEVDEEEESSSSSSRSSPDSCASSCSLDFPSLIPENAHRRQMLDVSILKIQSMNNRTAELRRSVLIFNTMRYLESELIRLESSPLGDESDEFELDTSVPVADWPSAHVYPEWAWSTSDGTEQDQGGCVGAEIVRSYEMLNCRAAEPPGFDPLNHQGLNEAEILATLGLSHVTQQH